jgi:regulatory protein
LLLKYRLRSERELLQRLKQKGFSEELCRDTVNFLKDKEFIDDRVFARGWVSSRLKRPFGLRRIKQELVQKGLSKEVIEDAFSRYRGQSQKSGQSPLPGTVRKAGQSPLEEDYDEEGIVRKLAEQRFSKYWGQSALSGTVPKNGIVPSMELIKARQRVYAYLIRRGFSPDLVARVCKEYLNIGDSPEERDSPLSYNHIAGR